MLRSNAVALVALLAAPLARAATPPDVDGPLCASPIRLECASGAVDVDIAVMDAFHNPIHLQVQTVHAGCDPDPRAFQNLRDAIYATCIQDFFPQTCGRIARLAAQTAREVAGLDWREAKISRTMLALTDDLELVVPVHVDLDDHPPTFWGETHLGSQVVASPLPCARDTHVEVGGTLQEVPAQHEDPHAAHAVDGACLAVDALGVTTRVDLACETHQEYPFYVQIGVEGRQGYAGVPMPD